MDTKYACVLNNFTTSFKDRAIDQVTGDHEAGRNHSDVKMLYAYHQNIPYLPSNVGEFFPNLESYFILRSNVQHLIRDDLDGLDKLIRFSVANNPIELIEKDFFNKRSELTLISFANCHLKKIEHGAFDGLSSITFLNLDSNDCISRTYGTYMHNLRMRPQLLLEILTDAYDKCTGNGRVLKVQETIKDCGKNEPELTETFGFFYKLGTAVICFLFSIDVFLMFMIITVYKRNPQRSWVMSFNINGT